MDARLPLILSLAAIVAGAGCERQAAVDTRPPPASAKAPAPAPPVDLPPSPPVTAGPQQMTPEIRTHPTGSIPDDPHLALGHGVYRDACMACHDRGAANAPMITDLPEWRARIAKGRETLYRNAINGYKGSRGYMPPKGGSPASWSDAQVRAAVDYIIYTVDRQTARPPPPKDTPAALSAASSVARSPASTTIGGEALLSDPPIC